LVGLGGVGRQNYAPLHFQKQKRRSICIYRFQGLESVRNDTKRFSFANHFGALDNQPLGQTLSQFPSEVRCVICKCHSTPLHPHHLTPPHPNHPTPPPTSPPHPTHLPSTPTQPTPRLDGSPPPESRPPDSSTRQLSTTGVGMLKNDRCALGCSRPPYPPAGGLPPFSLPYSLILSLWVDKMAHQFIFKKKKEGSNYI
jgi:hypothetical protein